MKKIIASFLFMGILSCSSDDGGNNSNNGGGSQNTNPNIISEGSVDFNKIRIPTSAGEGLKWVYQDDISDDFNYEFGATSARVKFGPKNQWTNWYHNSWEGPGLTKWDESNVSVTGGNLKIITRRVEGEMKTYKFNNSDVSGKATRLGCVSSNKQIVFPVYIETRAKIPNSVTACAAWLLSPDDTQEIDFLEAWGGEYERNTTGSLKLWENLHFSHHVFIREPFTDYQPKDSSTWYSDPSVEAWNDQFHRFGVYWKSPTLLEYYLDGKLVKVTNGLDGSDGLDGIDPKNFTSPDGTPENRTGLNKPMDIIIDLEDQNWRAGQGSTPTDEEIKNEKDHTFLIDWIRIYKAVEE
ncbi:LamG domain-containing protein [Aquimarina agarilytica]|uniref:family 16 glycosylhydrolase n=1 Tax=Aquimarina agarilytica TaxID=1087449 RepID=UPI0002FEE3A2|nr:family 16 glycosylhydrolase [Aquimarina agarilytica]